MARYDIDALVEETIGALGGHTLDQEQVTWLSSSINATTTTFNVNDSERVRRGIAEIGTELVYVSSSDSGTVTLAPFGRGYQGTTAATWPANTRVTFGPRFPRERVKQTINDVVISTWPMLFSVDTVEITSPTPSQVTYELPTDAEDVLTVTQQILGPSGFERSFRQFSVNRDGTTPTLDIFDRFETANPLRVTYIKRPVVITSTFSDSGLDERAWPVIKFGALHQLIAPQEAGMTGLHSVKASEAQRDRVVSPTSLSRQYYAIYQQLLQEERIRLLSEYEVTNNKVIY